MSSGHISLVRRMQQQLAKESESPGRDAWVAPALTEFGKRIQRLHRLGNSYQRVGVSEHIAGMRAAPVPDRSRGVASPRRA